MKIVQALYLDASDTSPHALFDNKEAAEAALALVLNENPTAGVIAWGVHEAGEFHYHAKNGDVRA